GSWQPWGGNVRAGGAFNNAARHGSALRGRELLPLLPDGRDHPLRAPLGLGQRGDALPLGDLQDLPDRGAAHEDAALHLLAAPPEHLEGAVGDGAARVDHEVRHVDDPAFAEPLRVFVGLELVVGRAGHDAAAEPRDRARVERRSDGARRVDVALRVVDVVGRDDLALDLLGDATGTILVRVRDEHTRAAVVEPLGEGQAHAAHALHEDGDPVQVLAAEDVADGDADAGVDAQGGPGPRVADAAVVQGAAEDPGRGAADDVHVLGRGAQVHAGVVGAAQALDHLSEAHEQALALRAFQPPGHREHGL